MMYNLQPLNHSHFLGGGIGIRTLIFSNEISSPALIMAVLLLISPCSQSASQTDEQRTGGSSLCIV